MRLFKLPAVMTSTARRSVPYRALMNQLVCLVATLVFWMLSYRDRRLGEVALYSFAIGNLIWLFIDGGRALLTRLLHTPNGRWPGWPAMTANIVLGTVGGYAAGTASVAWLLGHPLGLLVPSASSAVLSLLTAVVATYFFYSRERLHLEMAAAEAARRQALESQLSLLQSQLEPHMLFNTLANLRVLIGLDPARAQAMLDHLIGFLRVTLAASRVPRHPLAAEFARLDDYLALMAIRMGERLQVQLDLPAELADLPVPPLLLQPLVENSIKHGLEPQVAGGLIHVSARREGDVLVLEVRDSGVGRAADATLADPASPGGFGLTGVRERLAALYGPAASLTLGDASSTAASAAGGSGTLAVVRLPMAGAPPDAVASTPLPTSL
jgi:signal transduction histidine kinase